MILILILNNNINININIITNINMKNDINKNGKIFLFVPFRKTAL